ncbi:SHOCT-like domain-containing protein [Streptomyces sp. NPDC091377]|uniref:SHOCT-like domain-containing protein n=1 Tax=Streptomyces sp. NPDC091377 TaxID=3365995 RepID=UPI0038304111
MNEQRRQVLQMLADGKITADEAERLISALERDQPEPPPGAALRPKARPKYLRLVVFSEEDSDAPTRINIQVPLQLLRAGVRLASLVPPQALTRANAELSKAGVPIDLTELKPQHLEELVEHLDDITVDIDSADGKVQVFCE